MGKINAWLILGIALGVYFLNLGGLGDKVNDAFNIGKPATATTVNPVDPAKAYCEYSNGATMTIGPSIRKWVPSTSLSGTGYFDYLYVDGAAIGPVTDGSTRTVTPGKPVTIIVADNSSTYYAAKLDLVAPCAPEFSSNSLAFDAQKKHELILGSTNSTMSRSIFNYDDGNLNTDSNTETVGTSATIHPTIKVNFGAKSGYSPYGKIVVAVKYITAGWDGDEFGLSAPGMSIEKVSCPGIVTDWLGATNSSIKCFEHAGVSGESSTVVEYTLDATSDDSTAATAIHLSFWDQDYFRHSVTNLPEIDYQNDQDAKVGMVGLINSTIFVN